MKSLGFKGLGFRVQSFGYRHFAVLSLGSYAQIKMPARGPMYN